MEDDYQSYTRLTRFEKKRKNTKWLSVFITIGAIFVVVLIGIFIFPSGDNEDYEAEVVNGENDSIEEDNNNDPISDSDSNEVIDNPEGETDTDTTDNDYQNPDDFQLELVESDDDNVIQAYTSTWNPIQTIQSEPHSITWEQSSQDWKEMMQAAELATGIQVEEMYYLWVSGNGPQSVIATFSDGSFDNHYRVYLTWIENQGWKPEKVELLREHDQLHRFDSDRVSSEVEEDNVE